MQQAILSSLLFVFICCHQQASKEPLLPKAIQTNSQAQILNGIVVHQTGGLEIYRAFLSGLDGTLINSRNTVRFGDTVCLNLVVKQGWIAENGAVSIGAVQTITAENGEPLFSSPDLFAGEPRMPRTKAAQLQLKTTLTKIRSGAHQFLVQYKVWDKIGSGEVSGHYRLQLTDEAAN